MRIRKFLVQLGIVLVAGSITTGALGHGRGGTKIRSIGVGQYEIAGVLADFVFYAQQHRGKARGHFRHSLIFQDLPIEFHGRVTCLAVDKDNGRLWIGGVVTRNLSVHPNFTLDIHQPGKDVWFRVLDTGRYSDEPDRTTFLGFEGGGGIITSAAYCEEQIWPDENERTNAVIKGKIKLKARN